MSLKLYKNIDGKIQYWETWDVNEKTASVHWGVLGEKGEDKEVKSDLFTNFRKKVQKEIDKYLHAFADSDSTKVFVRDIFD